MIVAAVKPNPISPHPADAPQKANPSGGPGFEACVGRRRTRPGQDRPTTDKKEGRVHGLAAAAMDPIKPKTPNLSKPAWQLLTTTTRR